MDDLKRFRVPVLILSGGEPLLRPDIFEVAARAKSMGFYVGLSTNGTLIDAPLARRIGALGFDYVGISLDGLKETHDKFRRKRRSVRRLARRAAAVPRRGRQGGPQVHRDAGQRGRPRAAARAGGSTSGSTSSTSRT